MPKEIKAWNCNFCKKYYKYKNNAVRHENNCFNNPKNKSCLTCNSFDCSTGTWWCEIKEKDICSSRYFYSDDRKFIELKKNMECWVSRI